jgi:hypothetical protein
VERREGKLKRTRNKEKGGKTERTRVNLKGYISVERKNIDPFFSQIKPWKNKNNNANPLTFC